MFGTTFTMEGGLWGQLTGVEIVKPRPDEIAFIGKAYQRILDTQQADAADAAGLRRIAADLQRRDGVEAILLAGTDLAVMFDEATAGFPAIDVARLHIDAIVERLCSESPAKSLAHFDDGQLKSSAQHGAVTIERKSVPLVKRDGVQCGLQREDGDAVASCMLLRRLKQYPTGTPATVGIDIQPHQHRSPDRSKSDDALGALAHEHRFPADGHRVPKVVGNAMREPCLDLLGL